MEKQSCSIKIFLFFGVQGGCTRDMIVSFAGCTLGVCDYVFFKVQCIYASACQLCLLWAYFVLFQNKRIKNKQTKKN